ncbi:hypothetical protein H5410_012718 [Solanum commersonii]|uniref:Uncharacterized protein n=1 Tax=Solanum commersonii TaxID=4109 RepID=A0A9J6ASY4_SOLCO|nr:hypothetical protein H5410_012718 [Solanum commersonii]
MTEAESIGPKNSEMIQIENCSQGLKLSSRLPVKLFPVKSKLIKLHSPPIVAGIPPSMLFKKRSK